jgi:hypothetical protein
MSAWTAIGRVDVGSSGATNITFSSIPATYTDLVLVVSARSANVSTDDSLNFDLNGTTANQSIVLLRGTGSTTLSATGTYLAMGYVPGASATSNIFGNSILYISNYSGSTNKSMNSQGVFENNATAAIQQTQAMIWSNTAAINEIKLRLDSTSNFVQYSSASLYGILKGSSGGVTVT